MSLAKLSIDIEARLAGLQQGLDKATYLVERQAKSIEGAFGGVKSLVKGLGLAIGVRELAQFVNATVSGVDALNDLSDATGESIERLSALEDIAVRTGAGIGVAGDAVIKLNKSLIEARRDPESPAAQAVRNLGLSVEQLLKLSPVQRLQEVGRAINSFGGENKLEYNLTLLGKSSRELAPLLKDLGEAGALNATVTTRQAEEAEKFNKELSAMQKNVVDASRSLVGPMVSSINETIAAFRKGRAEGKGFWATVFSQPIRGADPVLDSKAGAGRGFVNPPLVTPELPALVGDQAKAKVSDFQRYSESLSAAAAATRSLTTEQQALYDIGIGKLGRLTPAQTELIIAQARAVDLLKLKFGELDTAQQSFRRSEIEGTDRTNADLRAAQLDEIATKQQRLNAILAQTPTEQLAKVGRDIDFLNDAFDAGAISAAQWAEAVAVAKGEVTDLGKQSKDVAEEVGLVFVSAAGQAISHWQGFRELLKGIVADLAQITLRETITKPAGQAVGDFLKNIDWASLFNSIGSAKGNAFGPSGIMPYANGGIVSRATLFRHGGGLGVMGEAGPEAILPLRRGQDGQLGVAAGGRPIAVTINVAPGASADDWRRSSRQIGADLSRSLRRVGAIA